MQKAERFKTEVRTWAEKIKVKPNGIYIQRMTTKWASCSPRKRICFSTDLLKEPHAFQTVVIIHELIHIHVPNHGKLFKSLMNAYAPEWEKIVDGRAAKMCGYTGQQST